MPGQGSIHKEVVLFFHNIKEGYWLEKSKFILVHTCQSSQYINRLHGIIKELAPPNVTKNRFAPDFAVGI